MTWLLVDVTSSSLCFCAPPVCCCHESGGDGDPVSRQGAVRGPLHRHQPQEHLSDQPDGESMNDEGCRQLGGAVIGVVRCHGGADGENLNCTPLLHVCITLNLHQPYAHPEDQPHGERAMKERRELGQWYPAFERVVNVVGVCKFV